MEGKIFNNSANLYQDQARVLFEYYKNAAQTIVRQEQQLEAQIADAEYQISKYQEEIVNQDKKKTLAYVLCIVLVGIFMLVNINKKINELAALIEAKNAEIESLKAKYEAIFRDYKVSKMGIAYVPVAKRVAYGDKSFIVDLSGVTRDEDFSLQVIQNGDLIGQAVEDLRELTTTAPVVETSSQTETVDTSDYSRSIQKVHFNDYYGKLDRTLRTISFSLGNVKEFKVSLPVVFQDGCRCQTVEFDACGAEALKETGTHLQTDHKYKQDQSEILLMS